LAQKSLLLDRFVDLTGYTRKSAIRLLTVEQEYATCQNQLARLQFESLDLQQRLEEAERKVQSGSKKKIRATPAHHPLRESYHET
jgi:predicted nuclease with TOPRIM domain